jgi:hypothetical protein
MSHVKDILIECLKTYARAGMNMIDYLTVNEDQTVFAVLGMGRNRTSRLASSGIIVRLINDHLVIEEDNNDKPLVDMLLQAGIPRDKIILAYQGEEVPEELEVIPSLKQQTVKQPVEDGMLAVEA